MKVGQVGSRQRGSRHVELVADVVEVVVDEDDDADEAERAAAQLARNGFDESRDGGIIEGGSPPMNPDPAIEGGGGGGRNASLTLLLLLLVPPAPLAAKRTSRPERTMGLDPAAALALLPPPSVAVGIFGLAVISLMELLLFLGETGVIEPSPLPPPPESLLPPPALADTAADVVGDEDDILLATAAEEEDSEVGLLRDELPVEDSVLVGETLNSSTPGLASVTLISTSAEPGRSLALPRSDLLWPLLIRPGLPAAEIPGGFPMPVSAPIWLQVLANMARGLDLASSWKK